MTTDAGSIRGIIVLGSFRSGTSLVCGLLHQLGVDFGPDEKLLGASKYNPIGFFEHYEINQANGLLLRMAGRSFAKPGSPETLVKGSHLSALDDVDLSWMASSQIWGLKDPRMCATLAAWVSSGKVKKEGLRIVCVLRDTLATAISAHKYHYTNNYYRGSFQAICEGVEEYKKLAQWQINNLNVPTFYIEYEKMLEDPKRVVTELAGFIYVSDTKRIRRAVSKVGKRNALFRLSIRRIPHKIARLLHRLTGSS